MGTSRRRSGRVSIFEPDQSPTANPTGSVMVGLPPSGGRVRIGSPTSRTPLFPGRTRVMVGLVGLSRVKESERVASVVHAPGGG